MSELEDGQHEGHSVEQKVRRAGVVLDALGRGAVQIDHVYTNGMCVDCGQHLDDGLVGIVFNEIISEDDNAEVEKHEMVLEPGEALILAEALRKVAGWCLEQYEEPQDAERAMNLFAMGGSED